MITCAQLTVRDEADITVRATAPASPTVDELWLDTSVTPHALKRWSGTAWVDCGADVDLSQYYTKTQLDTKFSQTDDAIALKADSTVTDALGNRLSAAEGSITTQAGQISAVVSQSQTTTNTLNNLTIGGRNYVRNSNSTVELNSPDTFTSVWMSPAPIMSDDYLQDCKGKSIVISYYAMCENLERATTGSWIGIQITYNTGTEGTYAYNVMTVTTVLDSGTKPWIRYRLTATIPANAVSVRATMVTVQNCKGLVRLRYPQVECGNRITDYRPASEDIALRMTAAESNITQQANQIALKVNTATYNAEKVYRGATAPASPAVDMLWLDTSLTPNLLKRYAGAAWVAMGAQELKTSGIYIGSGDVRIQTEAFLLQLLDPANNENVLMEMSADGSVGFNTLYADTIRSDSVASAYNGPASLTVNPAFVGVSTTTFRTLGEAVANVNNKCLCYDVTISLTGTTVYEPNGIGIRGISGAGTLTITGAAGSELNTYITVMGCSAYIRFYNIAIRESRPLNGAYRNSNLVDCRMNHFLEFDTCTLNANGTTWVALYSRYSIIRIANSGLYNAINGLEIESGTGIMRNCTGSCSQACMVYAGIIFTSGTRPTGSLGADQNGQIFSGSTTTNTGTNPNTTTANTTGTFTATTTRTWAGSWRTDTLDVIQGLYSEGGYTSAAWWNRGCMWFGSLQSALSGRTVRYAALTLTRKMGGSSNAKTVYLGAITNTSPSGQPNVAVSYGALGTIGRYETVTFGIPAAAVQGLANGTYGGLCLYEPVYNFGSASWSDSYMRMGCTDTNPPYLTVMYS